MITAERRNELLAGYSLEAITKGDAPRWTDVRSAPKWAQDRIVEVRAALADNKPVPPPSREYIQDAERRAASAVRVGAREPVDAVDRLRERLSKATIF